ncbi:hypothetical protein A3J90_02630 [candidate division WOR-1 bacterium RIFOXYC2_FULL_37_10]|uniref:Uncharacterized protein n=1 Tax=candidate division WOR-1 bacterium RIFOXYB2_FULL_37_13 TaxID=1802579 RepID=A0A1F4SKV8_UNCSA|nr:MAG: hypothetical protein A2246_01350 [candidate division WOR-1 bacterium RIFOXYA2_FULL_37_7]OGC21050.1 MAG: hypothetical protein A2310_08665 [candidate division WOR-1 bacterium RIFOXYB2_FULL_37_13]OGC33711.1 MAG: hypothetical protein A3J90_02630 [candidate division WOR-1 bacterium RIFOXYC2_FULL_37_10]
MKSKNVLIKQAETLVSGANIFAVSSFVPTLDRFPILSEIDLKHWDFIVSVAGVFIAASLLNNLQLKSDQEDLLMEIVAKKLNDWDPDGIRAFEDCKSLFETEYDRLKASSEYQKDNRFLSSDALGIWIVWNLFGRQPQSDEEVNFVRTIGSTVTHAFFDWWQ